MTCPMPHAPFSDFSSFGMEPQSGGRFIDVSVGESNGEGLVKGLMLQYPNGRIGSLTISRREGLDSYEGYQLDTLIERCNQGGWALQGLKNATPPGTYAAMLVLDAIIADFWGDA